ncbi:MAG: PAS domain S-box protein [Lentisphaerales bacterium]|nr:MAG: PAS domain S-box protein [Lentisphaerales bacterium]
MIFLFQLICFLEAWGLVLAIRRLRRVARELEEQEARNEEVQSRNVQLLVEIENVREDTKTVRSWYRQLFENTGEMIFVHGITEGKEPGRFLEVNRAACKALGYTLGEIREMTLMEIEEAGYQMPLGGSGNIEEVFSEEYIGKWIERASSESARHRVEQVLRSGELVCERVLKAKGGKKIPVEIHARRLLVDGSVVVMLTAKDLSNRVEHEKARIESESRLESFFDRSPFGLAMYDGKRELVKVNRACLDMFGFPDEEQLGRFDLFANPYAPADVKGRLIRGETVQYEAVVDFDEAVRGSLCVTSRKGRGWFVVAMSNMGFEGSRPKGFFAEVKDISRQRRLEEDLRKLQESGDRREEAAGSLRDVVLTDLMQIVCAGGRNMQLTLSDGKKRALIVIRGGEIIHCRAGSLSGAEAFYELMKWKDGEFTAMACSKFPEPTIHDSLMSLLMEGARQTDEGE